MAKCIRVIEGFPVRMSDEDAFQVVVRDGDGEYCSKRFWKAWYGPSAEFPDKVVHAPDCAKLAGANGNTITWVDSLHHNQHKRRKDAW